MVAFESVPAIVATALDDVDFFPLVLAYIAGPEVAGLAVEGETPGVAQAVGPDFGASATVGEGVVRRDGVGLLGRGFGDVDAEDGAE